MLENRYSRLRLDRHGDLMVYSMQKEILDHEKLVTGRLLKTIGADLVSVRFFP